HRGRDRGARGEGRVRGLARGAGAARRGGGARGRPGAGHGRPRSFAHRARAHDPGTALRPRPGRYRGDSPMRMVLGALMLALAAGVSFADNIPGPSPPMRVRVPRGSHAPAAAPGDSVRTAVRARPDFSGVWRLDTANTAFDTITS